MRERQALYGPGYAQALAPELKAAADASLRADLSRSDYYAQLLCRLAEVTADGMWQALALRALGNIANIGRREYAAAVSLYDQAAAIYRNLGRDTLAAEALVGKVGALAIVGQYDDAFATAERIGPVLQAHERWPQYVTLMMNVGLIYGRLRDDVAALRVFDQAREANQRLAGEGAATRLMIENNRAIHLRNLGRYQEALQAGDKAHALAEQLGYNAEMARIEHNQASLWTSLGNYNQALQLFARARQSLSDDGRTRDALLVDCEMNECWLHLGRYDRVIEICRQARPLFARLEAHIDIAFVILYESVALVRLGRYADALETLGEAAQHFTLGNSPVNVAVTRLEAAAVLHLQAEEETSLQLALNCMQVFEHYAMPVEVARACLIAARSALALHQHDVAARHIDAALAAAPDVAALAWQAHYLRGCQAETAGQLDEALLQYDRAMTGIEQLRGHVMVEFRASFVADKQDVYESAVRAALALGDAPRALQTVERCKSRALIDLLSDRLDLTIHPRAPDDGERVREINALREERDQLYRRQEAERQALREAGDSADSAPMPVHDAPDVQRTIAQLERQITDRWHDLLIHNADYARDGALWQPQTESVQPWLDDRTALIEYFSIGGRYHAFITTTHGVAVRALPATDADIDSGRHKLGLNFKAVSAMPHKAASLTINGRRILQQLHQVLIAPLYDAVQPYERIIMVPHGRLHGLPMHALFDGTAYLLEQHELSYLPSAAVLRYCREPRHAAHGMAVFGCSHAGRLGGAVQEAQQVAARMNGRLYVEREATLAQWRAQAADSSILHLATHAEFSADNPLFSYLALDDGSLTALDIFNLRLNASLVTLSACQTGESAVGGGDELHGLTRAFLYAGAATLVLSGWKVNDVFTAALMDRFYCGLAEGQPKGHALRQAQLSFVRTPSTNEAYAHPQYWAGFSLVGDWGHVRCKT